MCFFRPCTHPLFQLPTGKGKKEVYRVNHFAGGGDKGRDMGTGDDEVDTYGRTPSSHLISSPFLSSLLLL